MGTRIRVDVTKPLATVQLDTMNGRGALDAGGWRALAEAFRALSDRHDVAAVVVRGTGGRAMAAPSGDPPAGPGESEQDAAPAASDEIDAALAAVRACRHPTVAVIEGLCVGADLEIAACCDLRVCGESSRFGAPIDRLGRKESFDDVGPLAQLLGASPALESLRSGDLLSADHARTVGLVSHVHPDPGVVEHGYGLAARVAAGAPLVNHWHKRVVRRLYDRSSSSDA